MSIPEFTRRLLLILLAGLTLGLFIYIKVDNYSSLPPLDQKPKIGIPEASSNYSSAIRRAGGEPITLAYEPANISAHLEELDGLLFPGGDDIDPAIYGEEKHPTTVIVDPERYEFESLLAKAWLAETDKPFLGICLGCQLLNVVQGGSLIQDIPDELSSDHRKGHSIEVAEDSHLYSIFKKRKTKVNSNHHQAVKSPVGENLKVTAVSPADGVIEAIEWEDGERFVLGVQWHPERMKEKEQRRIFEKFVRAAAKSEKTP